MPGFIPGPPYFFVCRSCGQRYRRDIKLGLFCPKCKSFKVAEDGAVRK
jgi:predicted Zn-ribbon and HTH transcriptional regulator